MKERLFITETMVKTLPEVTERSRDRVSTGVARHRQEVARRSDRAERDEYDDYDWGNEREDYHDDTGYSGDGRRYPSRNIVGPIFTPIAIHRDWRNNRIRLLPLVESGCYNIGNIGRGRTVLLSAGSVRPVCVRCLLVA